MAARRAAQKRTPKTPAARRVRTGNHFLIVGNDPYLRDLLREQIVGRFLAPGDREFGLVSYDLSQASLGEALGRASTPGLFASRQVLVMDRLEKMREEDVAALESYLDAPTENTVLVFCAEKLDKRTRAARLLEQACEVHEADSPESDAEALEAVRRFASELQCRITREAAEELVWAVGNNLALLRREMEKLAVYAGPGGSVTPAEVAELVVAAREFGVFEMAGLLAERRRPEALARLRRMVEMGAEPIAVVGALAWLFRQLLRARSLPSRAPAWQARKALGFRGEEYVEQAHRFSEQQLRAAFGLLFETDIALKSSAPDPVAILEALVVALTETARPVRRAV